MEGGARKDFRMSKPEPYLKKLYDERIAPELAEEFALKNRHQIPRLVKIVINSAIGSDADKAFVQEVQKEISLIAGQKSVPTKAGKSISNFKLRKGMVVGAKVTLRARNMYEFFLKLKDVVLPKIRDFRGIPNKMDGHGNYSIGINDHTIFPEINIDRERKLIGMDIAFVTTAKDDKQGHALLAKFGLPFRKRI
ncbi:MAG: 50S ribosomal protein L5 [Puniceicoccales bacterium]|jgi:large subunit ribosomal protein L5|nr:50S ribosomal protein L5 [Puniceicoccales bacterium]